ncbi:MAG: dienelactone hydrolase family protein [Candidatus Marinimicrobia bacterium]|nr:dienelactone hydrolase family protein [Candidatus Neomarinimicrobiota bacterium]
MKKILLIILPYIFVSGCSVIMPKIVPFKDLPTPTGEYLVGTQIFNWTDSTRDEWFTENDLDDKRKLVVQIWYPTNAVSDEKYPYMDNPEKRLGPLSEQLELPVFMIRHIQDIQTNSILNAPLHPDIDKMPVILFSHGLGGMRAQNTAHIEELVSRGYFVIAPDHPFDANITIFDDGTIADYRSGLTFLQAKRGKGVSLTEKDFWEFRLPQIKTRTADIQYLLDELELKNRMDESPWASMDLERIGIFGHSYGGATSVMASHFDERIDACISLDGWNVPIPQNVIDDGLRVPFLYIGRPKWDTDLNYEKLDTLISRSSKKTAKLILDGTKHFDYSDTPYFSPMAKRFGISGKLPTEEILSILNGQIISFFDTHVK